MLSVSLERARYGRRDDLVSSMARRKLTEFEKVRIIADRKAEHQRQFSSVEIEVIVEDYTDERGTPRVIVRAKS